MEIIIEGPDNAGKSTLAKMIGEALGRQVIPSEGREKYDGEINDRVNRYFKDYNNVIFDRHPVVSQAVYFICGNKTNVNEELVEKFYKQQNIYVYCRPLIGRKLKGHVVKDYDDPAFLEEIEKKYDSLVAAYDKWALEKANFIYRIGDNITNILKGIEGALNERK